MHLAEKQSLETDYPGDGDRKLQHTLANESCLESSAVLGKSQCLYAISHPSDSMCWCYSADQAESQEDVDRQRFVPGSFFIIPLKTALT